MLNYFFLLRVLQHIFYEAGGKHPFSSNEVSLVRSNHCKALYIKLRHTPYITRLAFLLVLGSVSHQSTNQLSVKKLTIYPEIGHHLLLGCCVAETRIKDTFF